MAAYHTSVRSSSRQIVIDSDLLPWMTHCLPPRCRSCPWNRSAEAVRSGNGYLIHKSILGMIRVHGRELACCPDTQLNMIAWPVPLMEDRSQTIALGIEYRSPAMSAHPDQIDCSLLSPDMHCLGTSVGRGCGYGCDAGKPQCYGIYSIVANLLLQNGFVLLSNFPNHYR